MKQVLDIPKCISLSDMDDNPDLLNKVIACKYGKEQKILILQFRAELVFEWVGLAVNDIDPEIHFFSLMAEAVAYILQQGYPVFVFDDPEEMFLWALGEKVEE